MATQAIIGLCAKSASMCVKFRLIKKMALLPVMSPSKPRSYCRFNISCFHILIALAYLSTPSMYHSFRGKTMPTEECVPQQLLASKTPVPFFSVCTIAKWFSPLTETSSSRQWSRMHSQHAAAHLGLHYLQGWLRKTPQPYHKQGYTRNKKERHYPTTCCNDQMYKNSALRRLSIFK